MAKRNLFKELKLGLKEIKSHQKGKFTLRTHTFEKPAPLKLDPKLILQSRTLEKWEQGKTIPNDQAMALILMTRNTLIH